MDNDLILINLDADTWFGLPGTELSWRMKKLSYDFDATLSRWLLDNVGPLGDDWWVEIDREADSLRANFKDPTIETWVAMKWCDNAEKDS
jgi:hypothetical protein